MRWRGGPIPFAALLCAACATAPEVGPLPTSLGAVELISWETTSLGPFCRDCDWVKVAAAADGRVWIESSHWARNREDWLVSRRLVTVSLDRIGAFQQRLSAARPVGVLALNSKETCSDYVFDQGEIAVLWTGPGRNDRLVYDFGCNRPDIAAAIMDAPDLLGIQGLRWGFVER